MADIPPNLTLEQRQHFLRSSGEFGGVCTVDDQMCDAMRQGICLPGARASDDEERCTRGGVLILDAVLDGSSLLRIGSAQ